MTPTADSGSLICKWAKSHNGQTCPETGAPPAYWCLACKRAALSPNADSVQHILNDAKARLARLQDELGDTAPGSWHRQEVERAIADTAETIDMLKDGK